MDDFNNDGRVDIFAGCTAWPGTDEKPSYMYRINEWAGAAGPIPNFAAGGVPLATGESSVFLRRYGKLSYPYGKLIRYNPVYATTVAGPSPFPTSIRMEIWTSL